MKIPSTAIVRYELQLAGTLAVLAIVPTNLGKLVAFLVIWAFTFQRLSFGEGLLVGIGCTFFTGMNAAALQQGIFAFSSSDFLGMPYYEALMWGFYLLHTKRLIGGPVPAKPSAATWILALLYSFSFAGISSSGALLAVTSILLLAGLILFHERHDLAYVGYMILLGAAIEYTGVHSGQWHYPGDPLGGVPLWFITLWGGVGLFLRRLVLPILLRFEPDRSGRA